MSFVTNWERFYTDSKTGDDDLVDYIAIDSEHKQFVLYIDVNELITDGYDENGEPVDSMYVNRFMFDLIVDGLKKLGLREDD